MPAERTPKTLRQTTLFGFAKPKPRPALDEASPPTSPSLSSSPADTFPSSSSSSLSSISSLSSLSSDSSPETLFTVSEKDKPRAKPRAPKHAAKPAFDAEGRATTDVLLTIKPEFTKLIAEGKKNHEYRKYKLKESVARLWLYETAPTSAITYVMTTTRPKTPGQVCDPSGIGNDDFDKGLKQSKYGYPVVELYRLPKPLTTTELKQRFEMPIPQGWRYATRKLVEEMRLDQMEKVF